MVAELIAADPISRALQTAREQRRAALIGYLVAGDPDLATTESVVAAVAAAGLDILELGVPYGDPIADGPTIAAAGQRALLSGTTLEAVLGLVERLHHLLPVVLFTYFNPVHRFGVERFAERAAAVGASGVIIPDLSLEELEEVRGPLRKRGLLFPLLVAPTTSIDRATQIAAASEGFIYVVSRLGVTGEASGPDLAWLEDQVGRLREITAKPLAVGFGISTPAQVARAAAWSDGVIVGSGLVSSYAESHGGEASGRAAGYVASLVAELGRPA